MQTKGDTTGLQRFGWNSEDQVVDPMEDGKYVLHSEAAKIISEKDSMIENICAINEKINTDYNSLIEEARNLRVQNRKLEERLKELSESSL